MSRKLDDAVILGLIANAKGGGGGGGGGVMVKAVEPPVPRWLRFDPANRTGLIIKAGTMIKKANGEYQVYASDTHIDLTTSIDQPGKDYFVNLANDGTIIANTNKLSSGVTIGRFHSLCADAGADLTMISPASPESGIVAGDKCLIKPYRQDEDPDFYTFYNKDVTAVSVGSKSAYDTITTTHPLSGYQAGDILPESVFCLTWHPDTLFDDAMIYDKTTGIAVDVYPQSGTGLGTRSAFGRECAVNRYHQNCIADMQAVGKRLLYTDEFTSMAIGANEKTSISETSSIPDMHVGGHSDTAGRRMISAIGAEDTCGYVLQWLNGVNGRDNSDSTSYTANDGIGAFGANIGTFYVICAGGFWYGNPETKGSRARISYYNENAYAANCGGRGASRMILK